MILTISTTHRPATDLGYLLHKNPARCLSFDLACGKAHVFYPEATDERCTAALLLDLDPLDLARNASHVNDRPYVASSFMSVAIAEVFGTALAGRCKARPDLVDRPLPLTATIHVLRCAGGRPFLDRIFGPLGYTLEAGALGLDETFPEWGESPYHTVEISKTTCLKDLLTHRRCARRATASGRTGSPGPTWSAARSTSCTARCAGSRRRASDTSSCRRFFEDPALEAALLSRVRAALDRSGTWSSLDTTWVCLDCELTPWSAKAQELVRSQYAAVGAAGRVSLDRAVTLLQSATGRLDAGAPDRALAASLLERASGRREFVGRFVEAYRRYCWPVRSLDDLRLAPFHLLATEGGVHADQGHVWHMEQLARICREDPGLLVTTACTMVDVTDPVSQDAGIRWWLDLTGRGGEGMVIKPLDFVARGKRGLVQPAVKCRGREYLRIIYGPDYAAPEHLERLRNRSLAAKRSLALREFALGVEALERFVRKEPLRRVHECVFGVLALESEPVDPRL